MSSATTSSSTRSAGRRSVRPTRSASSSAGRRTGSRWRPSTVEGTDRSSPARPWRPRSAPSTRRLRLPLRAVPRPAATGSRRPPAGPTHLRRHSRRLRRHSRRPRRHSRRLRRHSRRPRRHSRRPRRHSRRPRPAAGAGADRTTLAADGHGCADREGRATRQGPWGHGLGYDLRDVARDGRWDGSDDTPESSGRQRDLIAVGSCMGSLQGQREGRRVRRLSRRRDEGHYESSRLHPRRPRMRNDPCSLRDGEGQGRQSLRACAGDCCHECVRRRESPFGADGLPVGVHDHDVGDPRLERLDGQRRRDLVRHLRRGSPDPGDAGTEAGAHGPGVRHDLLLPGRRRGRRGQSLLEGARDDHDPGVHRRPAADETRAGHRSGRDAFGRDGLVAHRHRQRRCGSLQRLSRRHCGCRDDLDVDHRHGAVVRHVVLDRRQRRGRRRERVRHGEHGRADGSMRQPGRHSVAERAGCPGGDLRKPDVDRRDVGPCDGQRRCHRLHGVSGWRRGRNIDGDLLHRVRSLVWRDVPRRRGCLRRGRQPLRPDRGISLDGSMRRHDATRGARLGHHGLPDADEHLCHVARRDRQSRCRRVRRLPGRHEGRGVRRAGVHLRGTYVRNELHARRRCIRRGRASLLR